MEKINGFKTFREFLELVEGKKKEIKRLKSAYLAGQELAPRQAINIPAGEPNSKERAAAIKKMMQASGGGAVRREKEKREERAEKVAKKLLKQQEGFSYGNKKYQQELEKKRTEAKQKKEKETQQRSNELYAERTRGRGIRSVHKGQSGWMKDGKFTPDT